MLTEEDLKNIKTLVADSIAESFHEIIFPEFESLRDKFKQVDRRFNEISGQFAEVNLRFERIDQRFESLERRVGNVEKITKITLKKVTGIENRLDTHNEILKGHNLQLIRLKKSKILV